jgi:autotransporter-associated beta strand protein
MGLGAGCGFASALSVSVARGAIFDLINFCATIGSLTGAGSVELGATGALTWGSNTSATYSGIMNGAGSFNKAGNGVATFGAANSYTGATNINAGQLATGANEVLSDSTAVTVGALATLNLNGNTETIGSLAGAGSVLLGAGALTAGGNDSSTTYSGRMSGAGSFNKAGNGITTFSGANTYTGATNINAGALQLGADKVLADTTDVTVASGATFDVNGHTETIRLLSGGGSVALGGGSLTAGNTLGFTYSGVMSGTGNFNKVGAGVATFSGVNTYTGNTHIAGGTLFLANTGSLVSSVQIDSGATFDVSNWGTLGFTVAPSKTLSGNGTVKGLTLVKGAISPGASAGILATDDQEWHPGGAYNWEIADATGSAGAGFDQLQLNGALLVFATSGNKFTITITSLNGATPGNAANFDKDQNYEWIIATTTSPTTIDPTVFDVIATNFTNDISADPNVEGAENGKFTIAASGNDVVLRYSAAPEPATLALLSLCSTIYLMRRPHRSAA